MIIERVYDRRTLALGPPVLLPAPLRKRSPGGTTTMSIEPLSSELRRLADLAAANSDTYGEAAFNDAAALARLEQHAALAARYREARDRILDAGRRT